MVNTLTPQGPPVKISAEMYAADAASNRSQLDENDRGNRILDAIWQFFQDPQIREEFEAWQKARSV